MSYTVRSPILVLLVVLLMAPTGCDGPAPHAPLPGTTSPAAGHPISWGSVNSTHPAPTTPAPSPPTPAPAKESELGFELPVEATANPVTMAVSADEGTERVVYRQGSVPLGVGHLPSTGFAVGVNFSSPGVHLVTATAYGPGQVLLAQATHAVDVLPSPPVTSDVPMATMQFLEPQWNDVDNPVNFAVSASASVVQVEYWEQGTVLLGASSVPGDGFDYTHLFGAHGPKVVEALGLDTSGEIIAKSAKAFFVNPPKETDAPSVSPATVDFISPGPGVLQNPLMLAVHTQGEVSRVQYWLDQSWIVGESWLSQTGFAVTCDVGVSGEHVIEARAYNGEQELVAVTSSVVVVEASNVMTNQQQTSPNPPAPAVAFVAPVSFQVTNPVAFTVATQGPVASVSYLVDDLWEIGTSVATSAGFPLTYSFSQPGTRSVKAVARDASQTVIATSEKIIQVAADEISSPPPPAPSQPTQSSSAECNAGELPDCNGLCAKAQWINDGICDDGTQYSVVFTCPQLGMDGGDCGQQAASPCAVGKIPDCNGKCAKPEWINDGICDDGSQYNIVLTCPALGGDGDDCAGPGTPTESQSATQGDLPYFCQHQNAYHPGASCQNTAVAMVLGGVGWTGTPDDITIAWGKNKAQSPAGLAEVFNSYTASMGSSAKLIPHMNGTITGLQSLLAAGKPTIIHGYFTASGHVLVATGYTGTSYIVSDPAGQWSQTFKGGYSGSCNGAGVVYDAAAFEQAISTLDGLTYAPLWYHELLD